MPKIRKTKTVFPPALNSKSDYYFLAKLEFFSLIDSLVFFLSLGRYTGEFRSSYLFSEEYNEALNRH